MLVVLVELVMAEEQEMVQQLVVKVAPEVVEGPQD
jgi:hypothetical protein